MLMPIAENRPNNRFDLDFPLYASKQSVTSCVKVVLALNRCAA
jgi:hypothetical protein